MAKDMEKSDRISNMKTLSERITWLLKTYDLTQVELAKIAGVSQPSVANWMNGRTSSIRAEAAYSICKKIPVMYDWLLAGVGEPLPTGSSVVTVEVDEVEKDNFVKIPVYKIECAAGDGRENHPTFTEDDTAEPKSYRASWLHKHHLKKSKLKVFEVVGDSMSPFLYPGDSVTVDTGCKDILNSRVYVFTYRGEWRIKRLRKMLDGGLSVISDNPSWPMEIIPPSETEYVYIVGRVVDRSGSGGL